MYDKSYDDLRDGLFIEYRLSRFGDIWYQPRKGRVVEMLPERFHVSNEVSPSGAPSRTALDTAQRQGFDLAFKVIDKSECGEISYD